MLSRFYRRTFALVGTMLGCLWVSVVHFHDNSYIPDAFCYSSERVDVFKDFCDKGRTAGHLYQDNGLLEVNPSAPHPIYELMEDAERLWNAKLARQSTTLEQAVKEYRRRYRRAPPLGFDDWWAYTEKHNVQLRDEYDQVWDSLEPFWGISPAKLEQSRLAALARNKALFTITKEAGQNITVAGTDQTRSAMNNQLGLLGEIELLLPPFNATFSSHDNPGEIPDYEWRRKTTAAAALKEFIPDDEIIQRSDLRGWKAACPPNSPYRSSEPLNHLTPSDTPKKTFIYDHKVARDACSYPAPSYFPTSGLYALHSEPGPNPRTQIDPVFTVCGTSLHAEIVAPTLYLWEEDVWKGDPFFAEKKDDHLFWRGSTTGSYFSDAHQHLLTKSHRARLVRLTSESPPAENTTIDILPPDVSSKDPVGSGIPHNLAEVNRAVMNVSFSRFPGHCDKETCEIMSKMFKFGPWMNEMESSEFKYVIDVDGNGWSGRFKRMMTNHALIFKSTIYLEWLTDRIAPWVHYVPVQLDYSDLYDSLFFFRGDVNGENGHHELAEKIAETGRDWSLRFWRKEDMTAYVFRLYLEYGRVMSPDRLEQNFSI